MTVRFVGASRRAGRTALLGAGSFALLAQCAGCELLAGIHDIELVGETQHDADDGQGIEAKASDDANLGADAQADASNDDTGSGLEAEGGDASADVSEGSPAARDGGDGSAAGGGESDASDAGDDPYRALGTVNPASGFFHPGVIVTMGALNFVRDRAAAGASPWNAALDALKANPSASLSYAPAPHAVVYCGSYSQGPAGDTSCLDEKKDALAAYTQALLWYLTGDTNRARLATTILNAWSAVTTHQGFGGVDNSTLQCGWLGSLWARAAEIMRYTNSGWLSSDATKFAQTLLTAYYPHVKNGAPNKNGSWELSTADAAIQIGVYADDRGAFNQGVALWRRRVPSYFYLASDGLPVQASSACTGCGNDGWWGVATATGLLDGVTQETCRDLERVQYGIAAAINAAETAKVQGTNLYADAQTKAGQRLIAALEFHAGLLQGRQDSTPDVSDLNTGLSWLTCQDGVGLVHVIDAAATIRAPGPVQPTWEIGYNEFANREGQGLPKTLALLMANRPLLATHQMAWETMTHAGIASRGLP